MKTLKVMLVREGEGEQLSAKTPALVAEAVKYLENSDREQFVVLHLNTKNKINAIETVSIGSLNLSVVTPREIFKGAILHNSASIILVHNHPSGDPTPSPDDIITTKKIMEAGDILGIRVLDHVIVGDNRYISLKDAGEI